MGAKVPTNLEELTNYPSGRKQGFSNEREEPSIIGLGVNIPQTCDLVEGALHAALNSATFAGDGP